MLRTPLRHYMLQPPVFRRVAVICLFILHIADIGRKISTFAQGMHVPPETELAFRFLDDFLHPTTGCHGKSYMVNEIGSGSDFNGGFASQFQMTAAVWLRMAAATNYTVPVIIRGPIAKYTTVPQCDHVKGDITCIFLPMSSCQDEYLSSGKILPPSDGGVADIDVSMVPAQFVHMGLTWWWGIIQTRMFRLQHPLQKHVEEEIARMKTVTHHGFPFGTPVAGLHVRHGDKSIDGFKDHSFNAELRAIHKSSECAYIEDDKCMLTFGSPTSATSPNVSTGAGNSAPIHIFVSSDDANVLNAARKMGYLVDRSGVSQNTAKEGNNAFHQHSKL
jgi:hypothetical protein